MDIILAPTACLMLLIGFQVADWFTGNGNGTDDTVIFHLRYGLSGAGFAEYTGIIMASSAALLLGIVVLLNNLPGNGKLYALLKQLRSRGIDEIITGRLAPL